MKKRTVEISIFETVTDEQVEDILSVVRVIEGVCGANITVDENCDHTINVGICDHTRESHMARGRRYFHKCTMPCDRKECSNGISIEANNER